MPLIPSRGSTSQNSIIDDYGAAIGPAGIAVYACLARHANRQGRCYPSYSRLARHTGLSKRSVIRTMKRLIDAGVVAIVNSDTKGNLYQLRGLRASDTQSPANDTQSLALVTHSHLTSDTQSPKGHLEKDTQLKDTQKRTTPQRPPFGGPWPGFQDFWDIYPRHTKEENALDAWNRLQPDDQLRATILAAIAKQRECEQWRKKGYIPHASNWLRQKRWSDDYGHEIANGGRHARRRAQRN
jgi:hypothetical protein